MTHYKISTGVLLGILLFALFVGAAELTPTPGTPTLRGAILVEVEGFKVEGGDVVAVLYSGPDGYPFKPEKGFMTIKVRVNAKKSQIKFPDVAYGTYALSVYHDENSNGKLDTMWFGPPSEGVGSSNNAKGFLGPPSFKDASFIHNAPETRQSIRVAHLF